MSKLTSCLLLAAPGAVGLAGLAWALEPSDVVKVASLTLLGPYLLGASKLYEAYAIRKTQRALLTLVPAALRAADRLIPGVIAHGGGPEELRGKVRSELMRLTDVDWGSADRDSLIEAALQEAARRFDPFVFLAHAREEGAGLAQGGVDGTLSEPTPA